MLSRLAIARSAPKALRATAVLPKVAVGVGRTTPRTSVSSFPRLSRREMSSAAPAVYQRGDISVAQYHEVADESMDHLLESLEEVVEDFEGAEDWEVDYSSGVLTLKAGKHGTYVINKQPPNLQIWLSSPTSGPKRYDYTPDEGGTWFYTRDGKTLKQLLDEELTAILGKPVDVRL